LRLAAGGHNAAVDARTLKKHAEDLGFDLVGICDAVPAPHTTAYRAWIAKGYNGVMDYMERQVPLREHPDALLPGVRSIVAVGLNYNQPNPVRAGHPRIARYALGRDYHKVLRSKLRELLRRVQADGLEGRWRICVDSAPIFERDFARLAGLGWFGKNTCLIDSRRGSWFVIGLVLSTYRFEPDVPAEGGCGTCTRCVEACPTGAIVFEEERWQVDARRCLSYQTIEVPAAGEGVRRRGYGVGVPAGGKGGGRDWLFGCDVCQEVCPFNQPRESQPLRAATTREPGFLALREWPSLAKLAALSFEEWDDLTRGSAVRRAGYEGLKANARAVLEADSELSPAGRDDRKGQ
jgi:epoxyqueuosine reductase